MKRSFNGIADEIAGRLLEELQGSQPPEQPNQAGVLALLAEPLADGVARRIDKVASTASTPDPEIHDRMEKVERKLARLSTALMEAIETGEPDEPAGVSGDKPKYQNLESLLKYVESGDKDGGTKLIIMNFND